MIRNALLAFGLVAALAVPAGAAAQPTKPTKQDRQNAAKACKQLRGTTAESREAFSTAYRNFGACVSSQAKKKMKARNRRDDQQTAETKNAAKECAGERAAKGKEAFAQQYGTNPNKRNAFGKCVSSKSEDDVED